MAFNLFGKRDKTPDTPPEPETPEPEKRPSFGLGLNFGHRQPSPAKRSQPQNPPPPSPSPKKSPKNAASSTACARPSPAPAPRCRNRMGAVLALTREVDVSSLEDLEAVLLASDIGSATTAEILEHLRQRAMRQGIESGAQLKTILRAELKAVLDRVAKPIQHAQHAHRKSS